MSHSASRVIVAASLAAACTSPPPPSTTVAGVPPAPSPVPAMFVDIAARAGLDFRHDTGATGRRYLPETMGAGGAVLDYDNDGLFDIYLVQSGAIPGASPAAATKPNQLYRALGDGRFEDRTGGSGASDTGYGMGAVAADYDNDGNTDLYVCNFGRNTLLRNLGDGRFHDVTTVAGVGDGAWSSSATFFDADGDGDLDLYVANYLAFSVATHRDCGDVSGGHTAYCHPDAYPFAPNVFYRNRGDGTFQDATAAAGFTDRGGKSLGTVAADFNDDGSPDVYVANDSTPNFFYRNDGTGSFSEEGALWSVSHNEDGKTEAGMGVAVGDVDGDGRLDIFVTNLSLESNVLYLGGAERFTYATRSHGLYEISFADTGFGVELLDLDNDADLDLLIVNGHVIDNIAHFNDALTWRQPTRVLVNDGFGHFDAIASRAAGAVSTALVARGSMAIDVRDDGVLDLVVSENGGPVHLFENHSDRSRNWIGFRLSQADGNRAAVGARVTIEAGGRRQMRELVTGSSYQSSSEPRLHFGLGNATTVTEVTVRWPGGEVEQAHNLGAGTYYSWILGSAPDTHTEAP